MHQYETDGAAIYRQSFAMIRAEADLARFDADEEQVAVRMIHAAGMVGLEAKLMLAIALHQIMANPAGLGHVRVAVHQKGNRAQRVHAQIVFFEHARWKR